MVCLDNNTRKWNNTNTDVPTILQSTCILLVGRLFPAEGRLGRWWERPHEENRLVAGRGRLSVAGRGSVGVHSQRGLEPEGL